MTGCGRGAPTWRRSGWLAAIAIPLVLLLGAPAEAWHEEHADHHECAICHAGRHKADLPRPAAPAAVHAPEPGEPEAAVPRVPSRRLLRRPARAPPA